MEPSIIQDETCVGANVKVSPDVKINHIKTNFVGDPVVEASAQNTPECSYTVSQMLCLKYSVDFAADVEADDAWIVCSPESQGTQEIVCPDVQEGPSVALCEPEEKAPEYKKALGSKSSSPQKQEETKEMACPDVHEGPSVALCGPVPEVPPEQQASTEHAHTNTIKRPVPDRFADRKILISKKTYQSVFYNNLTFRYSRH